MRSWATKTGTVGMQPKDRKRFAAALAQVATTFGMELDQARITGYWAALDDLSIEDVLRGLAESVRTEKFFPAVATIRDLALGRSSRAEVVWGKLVQAVARIGSGKSVTFDDPLTNATVRALGGWIVFCHRYNTEPDADRWLRQAFVELYRKLSQSGVSPEQCRPLVGEHDEHNMIVAPEFVRPPVVARFNLPSLPGLEAQREAAKALGYGATPGNQPSQLVRGSQFALPAADHEPRKESA